MYFGMVEIELQNEYFVSYLILWLKINYEKSWYKLFSEDCLFPSAFDENIQSRTMSRRFNSEPSSDFVQFDQQNLLMFPCLNLSVMLFFCMHAGPCVLLLTFTHGYWLSVMITQSLNGFSELYLDPLFWSVPFLLIVLIERQFEFKMSRESRSPDWIMIMD